MCGPIDLHGLCKKNSVVYAYFTEKSTNKILCYNMVMEVVINEITISQKVSR
jgi:hypothetical protein